jgi:glycine/D-amino acid oxidase-like deaminating enzyme
VAWDLDPEVLVWPGRPSLHADVVADACVVGLGASGLAAIEALLARGLTVMGIDAGRVASGAAGRNGGFLLGGSAAFLPHAIQRLGEQPALELYHETLAELDRLEHELGPAVVRRTGSIRLAGAPRAPAPADEVDDCAAHLAALMTAGIAAREYAGELGRGIYLPDDAAMNPARRALTQARMVGARADLYERTPALEIRPGHVGTPSGTVSSGLVIVAVDGGLDVILPQLAGSVRTARLQMLATAPLPPGRLPCPVYSRWGYDYAQQDGSGRFFVGGARDRFAEQEWTTSTEPTEPVQAAIERIAIAMAGGPVTVTHRWGASVGFTPDGRPLCIEVEPNVIAIGGYNGTGNLVGPIAARAAVALAVDGRRPPTYLRSSFEIP